MTKPKKKNPNAPTKNELEELYLKTKNELIMLSEITHAMMQSLELDQVLYTILSALTSHDGLNFDRALFFSVNEEFHSLEGKMGIGPSSEEEYKNSFKVDEKRRSYIGNLINTYHVFKNTPESGLNAAIKNIKIPLKENMGILALTVLEGMPFVVDTERSKAMVNPNVKEILATDSFISIPLKTKNRTVGAILVDNIYSATHITKDNIRILNMFAEHAALAIENSQLYQNTIHLTQTDWLTGLWNPQYFNNMLQATMKAFENEDICLTLLLIDIDDFKRINDSLGHQTGDEIIRKVSDILKRFSRKSDLACRYGGEEFAIIMANVDQFQAQKIAERLRAGVEEFFTNADILPDGFNLTVSLGLSVFPFDTKNKDELIRMADVALYKAKGSGKNAVILYSPEIEPEK